MMKRHTLFFLVAFAFIGLRAQNWRPISFGETHHFRSDTANFFPDRSIRVDSSWNNPGDTTWFLTRYLEQISLDQAVVDLPGFCQRELHVLPNGWYRCSNPGNMVIHATAALNDSWLLDTAQSISATVENIWSGTVLGQPDSLKLLRLTGGDSLILSQNHGIVEWPAVLGNGHFQLVGLHQAALGDRYPTFDEWFPYQVGQTFFWEAFTSIWDGVINDYHGHLKMEITSVIRDSTGIRVDGNLTMEFGIATNGSPINWWPYGTSNGELFAIYDTKGSAFARLNHETWSQPDSILVFYHRDLFDFRLGDMSPNHLSQYSKSLYNNTHLKVELSQADTARVLNIGQTLGNQLGCFGPGSGDTLSGYAWDLCEYRIRSGLGLEHIQHQAIDEHGYANLVGYITLNGDTVGNAWRTWFMTGISDPMPHLLETYPNPASDRLQIAWDNADPWSLSLMDLQGTQIQSATGEGKAHELNVRELPAGIYMLRLTQGARTAVKKVVVAH